MTTPSLFDVEQADQESSAPARTLVLAYYASRFLATCRSCGQDMTMVRLVGSGKWMPFDEDPVALKTSLCPETQKLIEHLGPADVHFRSCPGASVHRKR